MFNVLKKRKRKLLAGFTLIEMFVVIAVIGILAGVVFRGTATIQSSARDTRRISDMRAVQNYLETYFFICGHYPGAFSDRCQTGNTTTWGALETALKNAKATTSLPNDPVNNAGLIYGYGSTSPNLDYVLKAKLENYNRVLETSFEGNKHGVNCNKAEFEYCLVP